MKTINILFYSPLDQGKKASFFIKSPLLSYRSFIKQTYQSFSLTFTILRLCIALLFLFLLLKMADIINHPLLWYEIILLSPIIYFLTEGLGLFAQIIFSPFNSPQSIHRHPFVSRSLGDFWGRRWNVWVQDWLRDISHQQRKFLKRKIFLSFLFSGLFHEVMVNLPYFLFYNLNSFGSMTLYFMLQGFGLWVEKKCLNNSSLIIKRIFLWLFILGPSPLFISKPILVFLGIAHE